MFCERSNFKADLVLQRRMATENHRAVFFDLFGTLIQNLRRREFELVLAEVAATICLPGPNFIRLYYETHEKRSTGSFGSLEGDIEHVCHRLGARPDPSVVSEAAETLRTFARTILTRYRSDALETLALLKEFGYKTGLISNCTAMVPSVWGQTDLGALIEDPIFSCSVGVKKPAREIYFLACKVVSARPDQCFYVADGNEKELTGASLAGMHPILFLGPDQDAYDEGLDRKEWKGPVISELKEILNMMAEQVFSGT